MKKIIVLLIIGFLLIGIGSGLAIWQMKVTGTFDISPLINFIRELLNLEIRIY